MEYNRENNKIITGIKCTIFFILNFPLLFFANPPLFCSTGAGNLFVRSLHLVNNTCWFHELPVVI